MKKLLLISYYFPPAGGVGVQRPLKFVKYLREFGWETVVFTAEGAHYPILDEELLSEIPKETEVLRHKIWEPYEWYQRTMGIGKEDKVAGDFIEEKSLSKQSFTKKAAVWIRGNLFVPDARRFWVSPSVKYLKQYVTNNKVDAILSTSPPHSVHLIARNLQRQTGIPWLADFRDPWTEIDYHEQMRMTNWVKNLHRKMEKSVLQEATHITTVSHHWATDFERLGAPRVSVITNGYDDTDFNFHSPALTPKFTIAHFGSLNKDRNPITLWIVVAAICRENEGFRNDLQLCFTGKTDFSVFESLEQLGLSENVQKHDHLPHKEALRQMAASQVLLLLINRAGNSLGRIPAKVFEYLAARRPVLCIGSVEGDAAGIVKNANAGTAYEYQDEKSIREQVLQYYQAFKLGELVLGNTNFEQYHRRELTGKLAAILNEISD